MDPEYELAIKISEYFEFLWDGRLPIWLLENGDVKVTFAALLPLNLDRRDAEPGASLIASLPGQECFREAVLAGDHGKVAAAIRLFLQSPDERKPRLRRAAKCAGLWLRLKRDLDEGQFADRYVPLLDPETDRLPSSSRELHADTPGDEEKVIAEVAEQASGLLAFDLIAIAEALRYRPFAGLFPGVGADEPEDQVPGQLKQCTLSVASVQYDLTSHFFRFPSQMSEIAEVLRFVPSFTARVADAVAAAAPSKSSGWLRRMLDDGLYSAANAFFKGHDRPPMDVKVGAGLRRMQLATTADLVEAIVREIDPKVIGDNFQRSPRMAQIAASEVNPSFAIGLYLLEQKLWCVRIANTFHIPVPFGVLLAEELQQVDRMRAKAAPLTEPHG